MKRIIALALTILLGSTGYVIVDHTIEDRVGILESQVESLNGVVSSLEDEHKATSLTIPTVPTVPTNTTTTTSKLIHNFATNDVKEFVDYISSGTKLNEINWYIDKEGSVTTEDTNGILGFGYSTKDKCFYATGNAWQRDYGYNELYDKTSQLGNISYDTINVYFPYKNKDWMIQFWKGQYGSVLIGAEIGVYNRSLKASANDTGINHYNAVSNEEKLPISLSLCHNEKTVFSRPQKNTWWQTGFVPGQLGVTGGVMVGSQYTKQLKVTTAITLDDAEMTAAFVEGLKAVTKIYNNVDAMNANDTSAGNRSYSFTEGDGVTPGTYSVSDNTITLAWS